MPHGADINMGKRANHIITMVMTAILEQLFMFRSSFELNMLVYSLMSITSRGQR